MRFIFAPSPAALLRNPWLRRLARLAAYLGAGGAVVFAALLLALRFWVIPHIEDYRSDVVAALTRAVGEKVEIGSLSAGWDGWNPTLALTDLKVIDASGKAVLRLPKVSNSISWKSLFVLDLRLRSLDIERPQLQIRRDENGRLHMAGLTIDPNVHGDDTRLSDWLLRQRSVRVRDALILWQDDMRHAPQLVLDRVNFRLESKGSRHRFGLSGIPPEELAAPLDLRGEVYGDSFKSWQQGSGKFYLRLDYAELAAWGEWIPLPLLVASGKGALRLWVDVDRARVTQLVADVEMRDLRTRLRPDLPELALEFVRGRIGWRNADSKLELFTRELAFRDREATVLAATDFSFRLDQTHPEAPAGEMSVNQLALQPLSHLARYLPLEQSVRDQLARYAPQGALEQATLRWIGDIAHPSSYAFKAQALQVGVSPVDDMPGIANLTASVDATSERGSLQLASKNLMLTFPHIFEAPLAFDSVQGSTSWRFDKEGLKLKLDKLEFANTHAAGSASGEYRAQPGGPGWIDVSAQLTRADGSHVYEYLPITLSARVREWVHDAVRAGNVSEARFKLKGDLREFPFVNDRGGTLQVEAKVNEAVLDYAPGWPRLEHIRGDVRFHGTRVEITSEECDTLSVHVGKTSVIVPDMLHTRLLIQGEAYDQTKDFLAYIDASPVAGMIDRVTSGIQATGNGKLDLRLELPLAKLADTRVAGEYQFINDRIAFDEDMPELSQVSGKLLFTEKGVRSNLAAGDVLGGPGNIQITSAGGIVHVSARGTSDLALLRKRYTTPVLRQLSGKTDWQLALDVRDGGTQWNFESALHGAVIDLPAPFTKPAASTLPLKVIKTRNEQGQDLLVATFGRVAQLQLLRKAAAKPGEKPPIDRAVMSFGDIRVDPDRPGLWLVGRLEQLDMDQWLALKPFAGQSDGSLPLALPLGGGDLQIANLTLLGKHYTNWRLSAGTHDHNWRVQVQSADVAGNFTWQASSPAQPNGKLVARLTRLKIPRDVEAEGSSKNAPMGEAQASADWPALDVVSDTFVMKDKDLGKLELSAHPEEADWSIDRFALLNADGALHASGQWRSGLRGQSTHVDLAIDAKDAGAYLERFGYPHAIKGAPSTLKGRLTWQGAPQSIDYPSLSGQLKLESGKGQFTKLDPGLGKLLGVLSLQALPRRITLDFHDVFSEGFAFDEIIGDVKIASGVISTTNFRIAGPAARVELAGDANIAAETQNLRVKVLPSLSTGAALGAAIVNPLIGGAVYLGSKVLKDPIDQMFAYEYRISGTWSDPHVEKSLAAAKK